MSDWLASEGAVTWEFMELHNSGYRGVFQGLEAKDLRKLLGMKRRAPLDRMDAVPLTLNARWAPVGLNGGVTLIPVILVEATCVASPHRGRGSADNHVTARPTFPESDDASSRVTM